MEKTEKILKEIDKKLDKIGGVVILSMFLVIVFLFLLLIISFSSYNNLHKIIEEKIFYSEEILVQEQLEELKTELNNVKTLEELEELENKISDQVEDMKSKLNNKNR